MRSTWTSTKHGDSAKQATQTFKASVYEQDVGKELAGGGDGR